MNVDSESSDTTENLNDVEKVLSKIGVSIRKTNLEFKDFDTVLDEIAERWGTLDNVTKRAIANAFAGIRQQESILVLLNNYDKYQELLKTSQNSEGTAERKYESYQESLQAATERLSSAIEGFVNSAEISELLRQGTDMLTSLVKEWLPKLVQGFPHLLIAIEQIRSLFGQGLGQKFATNLLNNPQFMNLFSGFERGTDGKIHVLKGIGQFFAGASPENSVMGNILRNIKLKKINSQIAAVSQQRSEAEDKLMAERWEEGIAGSEFDYSDEQTNYLSQQETEINQLLDKEKALREQSVQLTNEALTLERLRNQETQQEKVNAELVTKESEKQLNDAKQETSVKQSDNVSGGDNNATTKKQLSSQTNAAITGATYAVGQLMQGVSSYTTAGVSHTNAYDDKEQVNSSEEAHAASRAINTAFSTIIPFLGTALGSVIGNEVAKTIDRARDLANLQVKQAEAVINTISKVQDDFSSIKDLYNSINADDVQAFNTAANNYLAEMYKSDNTETRELLQKELNKLSNDENNNNLTLQQVIKDTTSDNIKTREKAIRHLEIAQKKVLIEQQRQASIAERLTYEKAIDKAYNNYEKSKKGFDDHKAQAWGAGLGAGVGTTAAVGASAVGLMAAGGAFASTGVGLPIGVILGLIGAGLAAVGSGAVVGTAVGQSTYASLESEITEEKWNNSDLDEKFALLEADEAKIIEYLDDNDNISNKTYGVLQDQLTTLRELKNRILDYQAYIQNQIDTENKQTVEAALLSARRDYNISAREDISAQYLTSMTIGQLKNMNLTDIYKSIAQAIEDDADLKLTQMYAYYIDERGEKQLSDQFIKIVNQAIQNQDEEIAAVLNGEAYTLNEALEKFGNSTQKLDIKQLQNFAYAFGVTIDELQQKATRFGELTLGEVNKTTSEQMELSKSYSEVMDSMLNSETSWLEITQKIIKEFPSLIGYMNDTPTLMNKIIERLGQLNELMLDSVWNDLKTESQYYQDVYKPLLQKEINENANYTNLKQPLLDLIENFSSITELETYLGAYDRNALLNSQESGLNESERVAKSLFQIIQDIGGQEKVTADGLVSIVKKATDVAIKYEQRQLDNLNAQKEALENITKQREYEVNLIKAKLQLEDALNNKTRVYRAGIGFVYEADQGKIEEAQKNLEEVQRTKEISELTLQASIIQENIDRLNRIWQNREDEADQNMISNIWDLLSGKQSDNGVFDQVILAIQGVSTDVTTALEKDIKKQQADREGVLNNLQEAYTKYYNLTQNPLSTIEERNSALIRARELYNQAESAGYLDENSYNGWTMTGPGVLGSKESLTKLNSNVLERIPSLYNISDKSTGEILSLQYSGSETPTTNTELAEEMSANYKKVQVYDSSTALSGGEKWNDSKLPQLNKDEDLFEYAKRIYENNYTDEYILRYKNKNLLIKEGKVYDVSAAGSLENPTLQEAANVANHTKLINFVDEDGYSYGIDIGSMGLSGDQAYKTVWELSGEKMKYFNDPYDNSWFMFNTDGSYQQIDGINMNSWGRLMESAQSKAAYIAKRKNNEEVTNKITEILRVKGALLSPTAAGQYAEVLYGLSEEDLDKVYNEVVKGKTYARGTYNITNSHYGLINELGTEAIITPSGTITALPSHTGIVPADITRNLWELGELAPSISRIIDAVSPMINTVPNSLANNSEENFNINSITINADETFDAEAFVAAIKSRALLTKNMH